MSEIRAVTGMEAQRVMANRKDWKHVEMQGYRYSSVEQEVSPLAGQAHSQVREIMKDTDFIGFGGIQIKEDGTYDVLAETGSEKADAKLKEMLTKTFKEDEQLSSIMEKIRNLGKSAKAEKIVKDENGNDTFVRAEAYDASASQWLDAVRAGKTSKVPYYAFLSPAKSAFANEAAVKRVEDWIDNGGDYPDIHRSSF